MTLWSIWRSRNLKIWDGLDEGSDTIVLCGHNPMDKWPKARDIGVQPRLVHNPGVVQANWSKPPMGFVKCSIDASFSADRNRVGIGMCLRDEFCNFMGAITQWFKPVIHKLMGSTLLLTG